MDYIDKNSSSLIYKYCFYDITNTIHRAEIYNPPCYYDGKFYGYMFGLDGCTVKNFFMISTYDFVNFDFIKLPRHAIACFFYKNKIYMIGEIDHYEYHVNVLDEKGNYIDDYDFQMPVETYILQPITIFDGILYINIKGDNVICAYDIENRIWLKETVHSIINIISKILLPDIRTKNMVRLVISSINFDCSVLSITLYFSKQSSIVGADGKL